MLDNLFNSEKGGISVDWKPRDDFFRTNETFFSFSLQGDEQKLEPQVMCFTQEAAAITALEVGPFNERECLIGVSTSGSIFVWSLTDGQCQFSKSNGT